MFEILTYIFFAIVSLSPPHVAQISPNSAVHLSFKHIYFPTLDITKIFLEAVMSLSTPVRLNNLVYS